ncbi:hypothetical protein [Marinospirillum alkaliphilum]|uniref:Lipocalin-like domain-containing protein n=1 Tax=Marinospirillum alkaliphilum DSM 21637 TaxID=1122209 RepID=A0A1K1WYH3_9GAMM|nr:hypothetical protein [Marinospirillum alkaliphilum]SFX42430.1 hypothetical protein SAMN02745752_01603 [Marinospirillum alkaliphilum DSM 21637]
MKKTLSLICVISLLACSLSLQASDARLANQLIGEWQCSQQIQPDPSMTIKIDYIQLFTGQRHFTLDGNMEMSFAGQQLSYKFEGSGDWSTGPGRLTIKTRNSNAQPTNALAQQLHDAGILDVNQLRDLESDDTFEMVSITQQAMELRHLEEDFSTRCVRR